ncbi:MAG: DUF4148 domain-containing protein [Curvibacter sp.]|nr:DUF4148 domain-containing protein [Curvibacter sp.]
MKKPLLLATLIAASALACGTAFAHGEADYADQFPAPVAQRSRAEVQAEASQASQHAADVDPMSKSVPRVKSGLTRSEVAQAAAAANRAGLIPHGEASF